MRKFLAILMLCLLLIVPAFAETFDLSSMSLDDLIQLRDAVRNELSARIGSDPMTIVSGKYIVGTDIKAGYYLLVVDSVAVKYVDLSLVWLDESHDDVWEQLREGEIYYLKLEDGMKLTLENVASAHLEAIAAPEWVP